jgi:hypothetical protein
MPQLLELLRFMRWQSMFLHGFFLVPQPLTARLIVGRRGASFPREEGFGNERISYVAAIKI